jgi:hypothetical protein
MKGTSFGSVVHVSNTQKYQATFYDPLLKKSIHLGFYDLHIQADEKVTEYVFEYYSKNTALLPKGISFAKRDKVFVYSIVIKDKKLSVFRHKKLKEVHNARLSFIASLI